MASSENPISTQPESKPAGWPLWPLPVIATAIVFFAALKGEVLSWDDQRYLHESAIDGTSCFFERLRWIFSTPYFDNYNPLHRVGYWIQMSLWGRTAEGYHLVSLVLHGANVVLAYAISRRLGFQRIPAILAASIFAIHPTRVEVVAWISAQKDLGATFFVLLGLLAYAPVLAGEKPLRPRRFAAVTLCFVLALLYKSMTVTFPLLLLVLDAAWGRPLRRASIEKLPLFALSGLFAVLTMEVAPQTDRIGGSWTTHAATVLQAPWFYVERILWPFRYSPRWWVDRQESFLSAGTLFGLAVLAAWAYGAWRLTRSGRRRAALLVFVWPLVCLLPVANIVPIPIVIADRYTYLALLGPLLALAEWMSRSSFVARIAHDGPRGRRLAWGATLAIALLALGITAQRQVSVFHDDETLWRAALETQPSNPVARVYLVKHLLRPDAVQGDDAEPRSERAVRALEIVDEVADDPDARPQVIPQLCQILLTLGREEEATRALAEGLERARRRGPHIEIALCHTRYLVARGRYPEAHEVLKTYTPKTSTEKERVLSQHMEMCLDVKDFEGYLDWNAKLLELRPFDLVLWYNREVVARQIGNDEEWSRCKKRMDELLPSSSLPLLTLAKPPSTAEIGETP